MSRRTTVTLIIAVIVALIVAITASDIVWRGDSQSTKPTQRAFAIPNRIQASFQPLTGLRTGAPAVVAGAVVNASASPVDATLQLGDLPSGVTLAQVQPSRDTPVDGLGWSCAATTCQLVDASGAPQMVAPNTGTEVMLAFNTPTALAADTAITITPAGAPAITVPLSLPNGATPLPTSSIVADVVGPTTMQSGTPSVAVARVTNVAPVAAAAGSLVVAIDAPAISGFTVSPTGPGWDCEPTQCVYGPALGSLQEAPPITMQLSAADSTTAAAGTLAIAAQASVSGQVLRASDSVDVSVTPPKSSSLSVRLALDQISVAAPATVTATVSITPTGRGQLTDPVRFGLALPAGLSANWGAVTTAGPWTCAPSNQGCTSTGPLTAGTPSTVAVPIAVESGTAPGTVHLQANATITIDGVAKPQRVGPASLVIVAPPVPEVRATMAIAPSSGRPVAKSGDALRFSEGEPRALLLSVTNQGSRPANAGESVRVTATPNVAQTVASAGGAGWNCNAAKNKNVSTKSPLVCTMKLAQDLASGATLQVPVTLAPTAAGSSTWTVNAGLGTATLEQAAARYEVMVTDDTPQFVSSIAVVDPLYNGGSGRVAVNIQNVGSESASGGIAVIEVPAAAQLVAIDAPEWNCLDATLPRANGNVTCSTAAIVAPGTAAPAITLELATQKPTTSVTLSAWTTAVGQYNAKQSQSVVTSTIPVAGTVVVDAGQDITVVTPQRGPNGTQAPAVVVLHGTSDVASARQLTWTQLCTTPNQPQCNGIVSQPIAWLGVPVGQNPTTATARFTAPATVTAPIDLFFELRGQVGSKLVTDQVTVHLVPASVPPSPSSTSGASATDASGETADGAANGGSAGASPQPGLVPQTTVAANSVPSAPTASIGNSGSVLQVPTRAPAQLVGTGTGVGTLQYEWKQTAGATATILGGSNTQPTLSFEAPTLQPSQQSEMLSFELTVTDSRGATATASISVDVVWGDDGLQVQLANGAPNVVSSVDAPVIVTAQVSSRGAPYTYAWSVQNLTLPNGTATNGPTLAFTAGAQPASGTAALTVTDSFGRVTKVSIPVIISALPNGEVPQAFCDALRAFTAGTPATLSGGGVTVTIPAAKVNGAGPVFACTNSQTATFTDGTAVLPGGITVTRASGQLTVAGVALSSGTVSGPTNWGTSAPAIGSGGLLAPFVTSTNIGVPYGEVTANGLPLVQPTGWTGATSITFTAVPLPGAVLTASATNGTQGGSIALTGTAIDGATQLTMNARGLVGVGPVDVPMAGTLTTTGPSAPVLTDVRGSLTGDATLGGNVAVTDAQLVWTPVSATGSVTLAVGTGSTSLRVSANAVITGGNTQFTFAPGQSSWSTGPGGPTLSLAGSGSVTDGQLVLNLASQPVAPWTVARNLVLNGLSSTLSANCTINGSQPCAPQFALTASATSYTFANAIALSGTLNPVTQVVALTGNAGSVSVSPVTVNGAQLTVSLASANAPTATAIGTAAVGGASNPATVDYSPSNTLVSIPIGTQSIVAGWSIPAVTALATEVPTTYTPPSGPLANVVSVPIPSGQLTAVGATQLPQNIANGVVPASVSTALASYTLGAAPPTQYTLNAALPSPWYIAGTGTAAMALSMNTIAFTVTVNNGAASVGVSGTGVLQTAAWSGGGATALPLTFAGALSSSSGAAVMSGTFTTPAGVPWTSAFGVAGLNVSGVSISTTVKPSGTIATLTGDTALPAAFATPLGIPTNATPTMTADLTGASSCAGVDLATGNAAGVDIGGAGFLASNSASLVVAPSGCTDTTGDTYATGLSLALNGGVLGKVVLAVNPTNFAITDKENVGSVQIGGLALTDVVVDVSTAANPPTIQVNGNTTFDNTPMAVSGAVQPPTEPGAVGTLTLASANQPTFTIGGNSFTNVTLSAKSLSVPSPGSSTVTVNGTYALLGQNVAVALSGTVQAGTASQLSATLAPTRYQLAPGDGLSAAFTFAYNSAKTPTLNVQAEGASLTTPTQTYSNVTAAVANPTTLSVTACATYMTEVGGCATVGGNYASGGTSAGQYSFTTSSAVVATLSGYSASTTLTYARPNAGDAETTQQTSTFALGLFDSNQAISVSGAIGGTLSGSLTGVSIRGLSGNAQVNVLFSTSSTGTPWYDVNITMNASSGCNLWSGQPALGGVAYRSANTTYYTLTGPVTFGIDGFSIGAVVPGQANQPLVLSNETAVTQQAQQDQQPANGLTFQFSMQTGPFTAVGTAGFDLANCSYSVGAFVQLNFSAGAMGEALGNAFKQRTSSLNVSQGNLFSNGNAPTSMVLARAYLQETAIAAYLNNYATNLQNQASVNGTLANLAQQQANTAQQQYAEAQAKQAQAAANYRQLLGNLATAQANQEATYQNALPFAEGELQDAQDAVDNAQAQVNAAQTTLETTTAEANALQSSAQDAAGRGAAANTEAFNAQQDYENFQADQKQAETIPTFELTLDFTHCLTCAQQNVATIDGELQFISGVFVGVNLQLGWANGSLSTVGGTISGGFNYQYYKKLGPIAVYANASILLNITATDQIGVGWQQFSVSPTATAVLQLWASVWGISYSATLADLSAQLQFTFVPSDTIAGYVNFSFLWFSGSASFGPDNL